MTKPLEKAYSANTAPAALPGRDSFAPAESGGSPSTVEKAKAVSEIHFPEDGSTISFTDTSETTSFKPTPTTEGKIDGEKFDVSLTIPTPFSLRANPLEKYTPNEPDTSKSSKFSAFFSKSYYYAKKGLVGTGHATKALDGVRKLREFVYTNLAYGLLDEKEKKVLMEKFNKAWDEYSKEKGLDIKDVISLKMKIPLKKDGKPDFEKQISFQVTIVKRGEDGEPILIDPKCKKRSNGGENEEIGKYKKFIKYKGKGRFQTETITLFEGKNYECNDCLKFVATAVENWTCVGLEKRKTYKTFEELQKLVEEKGSVKKTQNTEETSETPLTINNCWLHEMVQRSLRNKAMKAAIEQINVADSAIIYDRKNLQNLIKCLRDCIGQSPETQKQIIEKSAFQIRKDFNLSEKGYEFSEVVYHFLEDFLESRKLIEPFVIKQKRIANKLDGENVTDEEFEDTLTHQSIQISASSTEGEIDVSAGITRFLDGETGEIIKKRVNPDDESEPDKDWKVTKVETTLPANKPSSITVEIDAKRTLKAGTIPFGLIFDPSVSREIKISDEKTGNFEFNYATIHSGSREGGHYFSVYKEGDSWFIYDNLQEQPVHEIPVKQLVEHLKHATVLVYEEKSKSSES